MTVYAYKMEHQARFGTRGDAWYRLTADTEDELHAFAARLGLPRQGVQPGTLDRPQQVSVSWHYTVTAGERERAVWPVSWTVTDSPGLAQPPENRPCQSGWSFTQRQVTTGASGRLHDRA